MAEQPMKVLVVSDVHGRVTPLRWLLKNETADASIPHDLSAIS